MAFYPEDSDDSDFIVAYLFDVSYQGAVWALNVGLSGKIVDFISFGRVYDVVLSNLCDSTFVLSVDVEVADQSSIRFALAEAEYFGSIDDKRRIAVVNNVAS